MSFVDTIASYVKYLKYLNKNAYLGIHTISFRMFSTSSGDKKIIGVGMYLGIVYRVYAVKFNP